MKEKFKILCISGGGIRGVIPATILKELESQTGQKVTEMFDLIVGTSTGGIIASGLASGRSPEALTDLYMSQAKNIFKRNIFNKIGSGFNLLRYKYSPKGLRNAVKEYIGEESISKAEVDFITTAYSTTLDTIEIFKSWKGKFENLTFTDVAMATSAAPTYFPAYTVNNTSYIDGGIYANSPIEVAWIEGIKKGYNPDDIIILSIGTGYSYTKPYNTEKWGIVPWLLKNGKTPLLNMVFNGVKEKDNYVADLMFDNFFYLDPLIPDTKMDETNEKRLRDLYEISKNSAYSFEYQEFIKKLL